MTTNVAAQAIERAEERVHVLHEELLYWATEVGRAEEAGVATEMQVQAIQSAVVLATNEIDGLRSMLERDVEVSEEQAEKLVQLNNDLSRISNEYRQLHERAKRMGKRSTGAAKQLCGENGGTMPFVLRQVVVGFDDLNRPITTCVVDRPDGDDDEQTRTGRLSLNQALVLQTLRDVIAREGEAPPAGVTGCPKGRQVVSWKSFITELRKKWTYQAPESEPEKRKRELQRIVADAGKKLQLAGFIDRDNERGLREGEKGLIWWTGKEDRVFVKPAPEPVPELPADVKRELAEVGDEPPF